MKEESNIIAIRKKDIVLAHEAFSALMSKTECLMNSQASATPDHFKNLSADGLEKESVEFIKHACSDSPFDANEVMLVSGQRFPDITAEKYYGIEVKSTKENHWTSTGSSIMETTRVSTVEDIFMLFGKLGGDIPEFRCRPYEEVLSEITLTHSPRYLIDMNLKADETIFAKMGVRYDDFRKSKDAVNKVRRYYREKAQSLEKKEMPWWITPENIEVGTSLNIKLWKSLSAEEKNILRMKSMYLFPEILSPKSSPNKYDRVSLWLCAYKQVVTPNLRDLFSAGGQVEVLNGVKLKHPVSKIFKNIVDCASEIKKQLSEPTDETLMLIEDNNPQLLENGELFENWLKICDKLGKEHNIPLRECIEKGITS